MIKWEYKVYRYDFDVWNQLGAEGWELVGATDYVVDGITYTEGYFKRRIE